MSYEAVNQEFELHLQNPVDPTRICDVCTSEFTRASNRTTCTACDKFFLKWRKGLAPKPCNKGEKCLTSGALIKKCSNCRYEQCLRVGMHLRAQLYDKKCPREPVVPSTPSTPRHTWIDPHTGCINYPTQYSQNEHLGIAPEEHLQNLQNRDPNAPPMVRRYPVILKQPKQQNNKLLRLLTQPQRMDSVSPVNSLCSSSTWSSPSYSRQSSVVTERSESQDEPIAEQEQFQEQHFNQEKQEIIDDMQEDMEFSENEELFDGLGDFLDMDLDLDVGLSNDDLNFCIDSVDSGVPGTSETSEASDDKFSYDEDNLSEDLSDDLSDADIYHTNGELVLDHDYLPEEHWMGHIEQQALLQMDEMDQIDVHFELLSAPCRVLLKSLAVSGRHSDPFVCSLNILENSLKEYSTMCLKQTDFKGFDGNLQRNLIYRSFFAVHILDTIYASRWKIVKKTYKLSRENTIPYINLLMFNNDEIAANCRYISEKIIRRRLPFDEHHFRCARTLLLFNYQNVRDPQVKLIAEQAKMIWGYHAYRFDDILKMIDITANLCMSFLVFKRIGQNFPLTGCELIKEMIGNMEGCSAS